MYRLANWTTMLDTVDAMVPYMSQHFKSCNKLYFVTIFVFNLDSYSLFRLVPKTTLDRTQIQTTKSKYMYTTNLFPMFS